MFCIGHSAHGEPVLAREGVDKPLHGEIDELERSGGEERQSPPYAFGAGVSLLLTHRQVELRFVLVLFGFCHSYLNLAFHSRSRRLKTIIVYAKKGRRPICP